MHRFLALIFFALVQSAWAADGYELKDPAGGKARFFPLVQGEASADFVEIKDPLLFLGCAVTWQSGPKLLAIQRNNDRFLLVLGHPYLYINNTQRAALSSAPRICDGRLVLRVDAMKELTAAIGLASVRWSAADKPVEAARAASPTPQPGVTPAPTPAAEEGDDQVVQIETGEEARLPAGEPTATVPDENPYRQVSGRLHTVVIDPGHGGHDSGAIGPHHSYEKEACLDIARRLAREIRGRNPGIHVIMTRSDDRFISLKERTEIANRSGADLFISIHNNASPDRSSHGTQVFFYDSQSSNKAAEEIARRENANANYLEIMLTDLSKNVVRDQSIELASDVEKSITLGLGLQGRRLQYAPFYVLAKTKMPAVLVETAFISNPREEKLLDSSAFRQKVADAIYQGIAAYKKHV